MSQKRNKHGQTQLEFTVPVKTEDGRHGHIPLVKFFRVPRGTSDMGLEITLRASIESIEKRRKNAKRRKR